MKKRTTDRIGIILSSVGMASVLSLLVIPHNVEAATTATPTTQNLKMIQFYRTAQLQPQSSSTSGGCSFGACQSGGSGTNVDGTATFSILTPENRAGNPPILIDLTADLGTANSTTATLKISGGTLKPLIGVMQATDMISSPTGTSFQVHANVSIFDPAASGSVSFGPTQEAQAVWLWTPPVDHSATIAVSLAGSNGSKVISSPIFVPASRPLSSGTALDVSPHLNPAMTPGLSLFDPAATSMSAAEAAAQKYGITGTVTFAGSGGAQISPTGSQPLTLNGATTRWTDPKAGQAVSMDATIADNGSAPIRQTPFYAFAWKGSVAPTLNPAMTVTQKITPSPVVTTSTSPTPTTPTTPSCPAPKTITKIEKVPGPTVTKTVDVPVTHTVVVTKTVDVPVIHTVAVTHTVTVTKVDKVPVPGPTKTVTKKVPGPTRTLIKKILYIPWAWLITLNAAFVAAVAWWARRVHRTRQQAQSADPEQE